MTALQPAVEYRDGTRTGRRRVRCCRSALFWLAALTWLVGCTRPAPVSGLRPEYPEARSKVLGSEVPFVKLDSVQPTLRWESFPRPQDHEADKEGLLSRIRNVTYDLKIWRADEKSAIEYPAELVYSRRGLPEPWHKLEDPLKPSTKYFWTVRARFELDGQTRITEWGVTEHPQFPQVARLPVVPNPMYYRFKTPSE